MNKTRNWIDGVWTDHQGPTIDVINPATGQVVASQPDTPAEQIDAAVAAARAAFASWRTVNPSVRAGHLHAIADRVALRIDDLATAVTLEMGKPLDEARGEARKLVAALHFYAEEATRLRGSIVPNSDDGFSSLVEYEPIGVVAAIAPWNYPLELIGWKLGAGLAAGCTMVIKPSEYSPSSGVLLAECIAATDLPPGVINMITGAGQTGGALTQHPDIDKIAFTGSGATGAAIARGVAKATSLSMELGGSCPLIVTETADLAESVRGTLRRAFRNAGQICISINRAYVHADVYDDYLAALAEGATRLVVADPLQTPDADVGPVVNSEIFDRTSAHIADAVERGARVIAGGGPIAELAPGLFLQPTVVADTDQDMMIMHQETFGPVIGVARYTDLDEAIARANSTSAGLASYGYCRDLGQTFTLSKQLDFGNVAINNVDAGIINAPYGGRKGSGFGVEHGREAIDGYLQVKHTRIRHGG